MEFPIRAVAVGIALVICLAILMCWTAYALGWNPPPNVSQFMFMLWSPPRWLVAIYLLVFYGAAAVVLSLIFPGIISLVQQQMGL